MNELFIISPQEMFKDLVLSNSNNPTSNNPNIKQFSVLGVAVDAQGVVHTMHYESPRGFIYNRFTSAELIALSKVTHDTQHT